MENTEISKPVCISDVLVNGVLLFTTVDGIVEPWHALGLNA